MLTRVYIHNFRTFINFETHLAPMQLLLGPNGAGKTALFDVIERLRLLICDGARIHQTFPLAERSAGLVGADGEMRIELDLSNDQDERYHYGLTIEIAEDKGLQRIGREWLHYQGRPLFESERGRAQLYRDDHSAGPVFPMDWSLSGVGFLMTGGDNRLLTAFKQQLERVQVLRIRPSAMRDESRAEAARPRIGLENFADWYRHLALARPDLVQRIMADLVERLPGFIRLRFHEAGDGKLLYADFEAETGGTLSLRFKALSDGQKALVGLYAVLRAIAGQSGGVLCIDEPENFLALPEIQPWLDEVSQAAEAEETQVLLISHHPRLVNFLAAEQGVWFERQDSRGPTRARAIGSLPAQGAPCLELDELIERGWVHGTV
jgi:predicted ATPase